MQKNVSDNISLALEKISSDPELTEGLTRQKTFDDLYDFCVSVHGGYTKEEFDEYMDDLVSMLEEQAVNNLRIDEDELRNISGGFNSKVYKKSIAYSLTLFMLLTSVSPSFYAADGGVDVAKKSPGRSVAPVRKKSFWQRHKKKIIASGVLAVLALCWRYYNGAWLPHLNKSAKEGGQNSQGGGEAVVETPGDEPPVPAPPVPPPNVSAQPSVDANGGYRLPPMTNQRRRAEQFVIQMFDWIDRVPFIGQVIFAFSVSGVVIDSISAVCRSLNSIISSYWSVSSFMENISRWLNRRINNMTNAPVGLTQSIDNLELLFEEVKGQEKAKEEVRSLVFNILHRKKHAQLTGKPYGHGDVLYFVGPSRVGKTLMARGLAKYKILTSYTEAYYVSASEIDKDSRKDTILDQLFGMNSYGGYGGYGYDAFGGGSMHNVSTPKNLVKYISDHPNGIVIVDEYDKMWSPALDEVFRSIVDNGVINVKGQKIDCSGITFILTSNESTQSIRGGNQDEVKDIDDGTGSRTYIKHDKSFLNRIRPVEFENLSADVYEQIIRTEFKRDLVDYWINPEVCGLDVVINDSAYANMAKAVEKKNQGAGLIPDLISDLFRDISIKVFEAEKIQKGYYRGRRLYVDYDLESNKFTLTDGGVWMIPDEHQDESEDEEAIASNNDENTASDDKANSVPNNDVNAQHSNSQNATSTGKEPLHPSNDQNADPVKKGKSGVNNDESIKPKGDVESNALPAAVTVE